LLAGLDLGDLGAAAERWQVDFVPGSEPRATAEAGLLAVVARPFALDEALASLSREERAIYDRLVRVEQPQPLAAVRQASGLSVADFRRLLRRLSTWLLVWETWHERERHLFVPAELRQRRALPASPSLTAVQAEPAAWRHPFATAWDLLAWLRAPDLLAADTISSGHGVTPSGLPGSYPLWHGVTAADRARYFCAPLPAPSSSTSRRGASRGQRGR
jgi:hypothetical protein